MKCAIMHPMETVEHTRAMELNPLPFGSSLHAEPQPVADFATFIRSRYPLVFVETIEEERAERLIAKAANDVAMPVFVWSQTRGMIDEEGTSVDASVTKPQDALTFIEKHAQASVFIMLDLIGELSDNAVCRRLKDFSRIDRHTVFLIDGAITLPDELRTIAEVYPLSRPNSEVEAVHARTAFAQFVERGQCTYELGEQDFDDLVRALCGLTLEEIDRVLARISLDDNRVTPEDVRDALQLKTELLAKTSALEIHTSQVDLDAVAGLDNFKRWAQTRRAAFLRSKPELAPPRGFILTGVPGCGKSLAVKALASTWGVPLLRLDAGCLFDKWMGETERRLRGALSTAEALAPSILWIDEIEKGFSITGPSASDGGLGYRMVGTLATWMQERTLPVLLAATSNNVSLLPPELTRQGRFDEVFFVDLPTMEQRQAVFDVLLRARKCDPAAFDLVELAVISDGYSGSELEQAVTNGLYAASVDSGMLTQELLAAEIGATRPLSQIAPDKVDSIRAWGLEHARPA